MPIHEQVQLTFDGGVNAQSPEHAVGENEVVTATNIDFDLEPGGATVRRGSHFAKSVGTSAITQVFRKYELNIGNSPFYMRMGNAIIRQPGLTGTATTIISTGATARAGIVAYRDHVFIAPVSGPGAIRDNGTSTATWVKASPTAVPTVAVGTLTALAVAGGFDVAEGTGASGGTATGTTTGSPYRIQFDGTSVTTALDSNGGGAIGDYGIQYVTLRFDNPSAIKRVTADYSIGDTTFTDYYHAEMDVTISDEALPGAEELVDSLLVSGTSTIDGVDEETRAAMVAWVRTNVRAPRSRISAASNSDNVWAVPRTDHELVAKTGNVSGWDSIQAVRVVIEAYSDIVVTVKDWEVRGAEAYPLNDPDLGYAYWETYARINAEGVVVDESAPSPPSARTKMQQARATITMGTGTGDPEFTHRVVWRQGGYLRSPYPVGTVAIATNTLVDARDDMTVLSDRREMPIDLLSNAAFPNNIVSAAEFYDRIFVAYNNKIRWSLPGNPNAFPRFSETTVSNSDDPVQAVIPAGRLVVVNRNSVYEMDGSVWEGQSQDWVRQRSGSRRGSYAANTIIQTPHGILLLDWDGIYMYVPGQGVDVEVSWAMARMADAFRDSGADNPAQMKGNRIPAINLSYLQDSSAAYNDGKIYLAVPTGTDTIPQTVFVLDFRKQRVQWAYYPFPITSMFWDREGNRLLAGTNNGALMWLEKSAPDRDDDDTTDPQVWTFRTRKWTSPQDAVVENLKIDYAADNLIAKAIYDGTSTVTVGTFTDTTRDWVVAKLGGTVARSVQLDFTGTRTSTTEQGVYGVSWDALVEPVRVQGFKTDYDENKHPGQKIWDVLYNDLEIIGTGNVTCVAYIDGTAVTTATLAGPTSGKESFATAYPADTYGDIAHEVYVSSGSVYFKLWATQHGARNEPPRVNNVVTDRKSGEEHEWRTINYAVAPQGQNVLTTAFVDNVAVGTYTATGTNRQSFVHSLPAKTFGRTVHAIHNGTAFKHYDTWFDGEQEPDRVLSWHVGPIPFPTNNNLKTWVPILDCLAGTVTGILLADGTAIATEVFVTSNARQSIPRALDLTGTVLETGSQLEVLYSGTSVFKHYDTRFEMESRPFGKTEWTFSYRKVGGASQIDMARYYELDIEPAGTATITSVWEVDGSVVKTDTHTFTERSYIDRQPFGPGARGYLFQLRLSSGQNFEVYAANLDMEREGIKGLARSGVRGTPDRGVKIAP